MNEVKTLTMESVIQSDTQLYIHNGNYTQYFIKDYLTGELVLLLRTPNGDEVIPLKNGITYKELNPNHNGVVYPLTEGIHPFNSVDFVTTTLGIYRIHLKRGVSYISSDMNKLYDKVLFKLENLATGGYYYAKFNEIHQPKTKQFYNDLYNLYTVGYPMVQAFIKGLIYNKEYADDLSYGEALRVSKDTKALKELFSNTKYGYISTPGKYNITGSDYHYFTELNEEGDTVTIKKFFFPSTAEEPYKPHKLVSIKEVSVQDFQNGLAKIAEHNVGKSLKTLLTLYAEGSGFFFPTERSFDKMPTNYETALIKGE